MLQLLLSSCLYISVAAILVYAIYYFRKNIKVRSDHKSSQGEVIVLELSFVSTSSTVKRPQKIVDKRSKIGSHFKSGLFSSQSIRKDPTLSILTFCQQRNNGISLCTDICIALALLVVTLVLALAVLRGHSVDNASSGGETNWENQVNGGALNKYLYTYKAPLHP